ncbi:tripartite tricarboxylate transporter substrate binding protein [Roseomonas nepalensis]|uniref:Tripartite tricarboxylate transporter substrate binding protein n=1 Tax=Muricoccus nepalensis TaxID=1854500 RepID=A0A502GFZ9_9PROT|nr:tripartite tricarboxylate transporter substrate binding protein [Roseomonas nepalensis]TPG60478.1 tripartite tricarboxylate transporter substrate binding protein [Roseomonas nepalensis]
MMNRRLALAAAPALLAAPALRAQGAWPSRPIRMVVPYTPGAATDAMARLAAQKIGERLGVPVVVENRAGGNGAIGSLAVLQAPPDGYTILGSASVHPMARQVMKAAPYDPVADFVPLARTARGPLVLVMDPRLPPRGIPEVVEAARRDPGRWSFAVSSLGAAGHLAAIEFNRVTGSRVEIVGYRGTAPALSDVAAGNAQLMFDAALAILPMVRGGQLRGLGIATPARTELAPDLPTLAEAGLPGFEFYSWYGVWGPRALPPEIVARLHEAVTEGMREPATVQRLAALGFEPVVETQPALEAFIRDDVARNAGLLRLAGFQPE